MLRRVETYVLEATITAAVEGLGALEDDDVEARMVN